MGVLLPKSWGCCEAPVGVEWRNVAQTVSEKRESLPGQQGLADPESKACSLSSADINFNVSGLFSALAPQDKVSDRPASEELPTTATPAPATAPAPAPAPASVATKER